VSINIVWPQDWAVPPRLIEEWFVEAVSKMLIPPGQLTASTLQEMAEALQNIGWIVLQVNKSCDTTTGVKELCL